MTSNAEVETAASPARADQVQVLLVEDDDGDALLVGELLREVGAAVVVRRARSLAQAKSLVSGVACVLLDLGLPDSEGLQGLRRLLSIEPEAAIVVLTGQADEHLGERAVRAGAQDYLVKGEVAGHMLHRVIRYAVERRRAEEAQRELRIVQVLAQENARLERGLLPSPVLSDARLSVSARGQAGGSSSSGRSGSMAGNARHSSITRVRATRASIGVISPASVWSRSRLANAMNSSYRLLSPARSQARAGISDASPPEGTAEARKAVAVLIPSSFSLAITSLAWSRGATHMPSYSGAKPSQRSALRSSSRTARWSSGMEKATSDHCPSHGAALPPKEKMRRAPSSSTSAARELSRTNVRRPDRDVTRSPLRVSRDSAALAAESLTPNSASSATITADGSGSVRCHQ